MTRASRTDPAEAGPFGQGSLCGRIGPNAVTRLAQAVERRAGRERLNALFLAAGSARHLADPPNGMVDEEVVARLHLALRTQFGTIEAAAAGAEAGRLTGDYLLANRIPRPAQALLRVLPRVVAAAILVRAVAKHAWTFVGSGTFAFIRNRDGLELSIVGGPICRLISADEPVCAYYAATFERVFASMLGPSTRVVEVDCAAHGAPCCRFQVRWREDGSTSDGMSRSTPAAPECFDRPPAE